MSHRGFVKKVNLSTLRLSFVLPALRSDFHKRSEQEDQAELGFGEFQPRTTVAETKFVIENSVAASQLALIKEESSAETSTVVSADKIERKVLCTYRV